MKKGYSFRDDLKTIGYYTGYIIIGTGMLMIIPLLTALLSAEWNIAIDFVIGFSIAIITGYTFVIICSNKRKKVMWIHGMVIASFSWLLLTIISAIPYYLSGNYNSFLDATFDVMSGFTTTGLVLIQDLDHVSNGVNMWRHILTFVGGQGMVVLALSFFGSNLGGGFKIYVGEAKDSKLLPSVKSTARAIWKISIIYLIIGTFILWVIGMGIGIKPVSAFLQALWIYMGAWSTGGFAPHMQNILYYHSLMFEIATIVFFTVGSFNFGLHYAVLRGNKKEIYRNIETISFFITLTILVTMTTIGLMRYGVYPDYMAMFRKGFYQLISGHTTTGFQTIYSQQFYSEWGSFAVIAVILSMLIGGSACSTAGGFKGLRVGITFKALMSDVKRLFLPESAITVDRYHYIDDQVLDDKTARSAMIIIICYIVVFALGSIAGVYYGYPVLSSMFEAASATGNVGLSIGITSASMPAGLKLIYIFIMWVGRLEFMSVFALIAFIFTGVKRIWSEI